MHFKRCQWHLDQIGPPSCKSRQHILHNNLSWFLVAVSILLKNAISNAAGAGFKHYAKGHLVYLLIRQFKLLLEDLSISVELDQAVDLDTGECSTAMH